MTPAEARLPKRVRKADLIKLSCRFEAPVRLPIRRRQQSSDDRNRVGEGYCFDPLEINHGG